MILASRQTLRDLTGRRRKSAIADQLDVLGVRYVLGVDGWPRVSTSALERLLDGKAESSTPAEPDFSYLHEVA